MTPRVTIKMVGYGLRHLNNPIKLRDSALISLPAVQKQIQEQEGDRFNGAYVLRDFIRTCCRHLILMQTTDQHLVKALAFLRLYSEEPNAALAARELKIGHSSLYATVVPMALELLAEEIQTCAGSSSVG